MTSTSAATVSTEKISWTWNRSSQGAGSAWKNGLAWVIIGGLLSSMFLTLVVVPLAYYLMDRVMGKFEKNRKKVELALEE
jgi:HAE1 family hydrophobic/amphiphilic exporter-1